MAHLPLNAFAAQVRLRMLDRLVQGLDPGEGEWDPTQLAEGRVKGTPQMGATTYAPHEIRFEFIFPDPLSSATILTVRLVPPERIVFLPVPEWVVENVWQGDVQGSHHFASDAERLVAAFTELLTPEANAPLFDPQPAKRRE